MADMAPFAENLASVRGNTRKLVSWKAIAEYLGCDVRTAKRWERDRQMPVHRAPGSKRSGVFAYTAEMDEWLRPGAKFGSLSVEGASGETPTQLTNGALAQVATRPLKAGRITSGWRLWAVVSAGAGLVVAAIFFTVHRLAAHHQAASIVRSSHNVSAGVEHLLLRGRYYWNLRTADSLTEALKDYTQAIVKDPSCARAYAGLAETYDLLHQFSHADPGVSFAQAERAANRAIELDPNLAAAHRAKAFALFFWNWNVAASDAEFRRALALDPNSAQTHQWYASTLYSRFERTECLRQIDEALRLDPTSAAIATDAAFMHASFGENYAANMKRLAELERAQPTLMTPSDFRRELAYLAGDYPTFIAELRREASITRSAGQIALAEAAERGWKRGGKRGMLEELIAARKRAVSHDADMGATTDTGFWIGRDYVALGEPAKALPYFRAMLDYRFIPFAPSDCGWASKLVHDPGYSALFAQIRQRFRSRFPSPALHPISCKILQ